MAGGWAFLIKTWDANANPMSITQMLTSDFDFDPVKKEGYLAHYVSKNTPCVYCVLYSLNKTFILNWVGGTIY
jgi:hypothetical protein